MSTMKGLLGMEPRWHRNLLLLKIVKIPPNPEGCDKNIHKYIVSTYILEYNSVFGGIDIGTLHENFTKTVIPHLTEQ